MKKSNKGFTLVEMLIVIALIAILVSILVPSVITATAKAKAAADAANLRSELSSFIIAYLDEEDLNDSYGFHRVSYSDGGANQVWEKTKATPSKTDGYTTIRITFTGSETDVAYCRGDTVHNVDYYVAIANGTSSN